MHVLVLGGYGFIGLEVARQLIAAGHTVSCMGRSRELGRSRLPQANWIVANISRLLTAEAWDEHLQSVDVVVNASGALQSGLKDNLDAIHDRAVAALVTACESHRVRRLVHISAVGADPRASTEFMRSKARGDERIRRSQLSWIILRPGLVLGPNAYGGSALLRVIAGLPIVLPIVFGDRLVQTVALSDVASVACDAVDGQLPAHTEVDLVEDEPHTLRALLLAIRRWLGLPTARLQVAVPAWLAFAAAKLADMAGLLGWRSPLRSTALRVLSSGVVGDANPFRRTGSRRLSALDDTLQDMPSTAQERWYTRMYLLLPVIVVALSTFWIASGVIALMDLEAASRQSGIAGDAARRLVTVAALVDIALGAALLIRPWARAACVGMVAVAAGYLLAGSFLRPDLWLDPLGPFVKVVPVIILALVAAALLDSGR